MAHKKLGTTKVKAKAIQVFPADSTTDKLINKLAKQLRTSRGGLAGIALDFAVVALSNGTAKIVNGSLELKKA